MKPSTLIQILMDGGIAGPRAAVVGVVLTSLRCDKCKCWDNNEKWCELEVKFSGREPRSYDFCSQWEKKYA